MTELFLDDVSVDISGNSGISLNYANTDIESFINGGTKGSFSYEITIPATIANKKYFYFPELILDESFDDTTEKTARLEVDGNVVLNGFARINSTNVNGNIVSYSVLLFEGNSGWISSVKDKSIRDIDFTEYDHVYNSVNQYATEWNNVVGLPDFVAYPYINIGRNQNGVTSWSVEDRYPAFRVYKIFTAILKEAGYKINSEFINDSFFNDLYITTNKIPQRSIEELKPHKFRADFDGVVVLGNGGDDTSVNLRIPFDIEAESSYNGTDSYLAGLGNSTAYFKNNFTGKMSLHWDYKFTNINLGASSKDEIPLTLKLVRVRNGIYSVLEAIDVIVPRVQGDIGGIFGSTDNRTHLIDTFNSKSFFAQENDNYYFTVLMKGETATNQRVETSGTHYFHNKVYRTLTEGQTVYINDVLPDIKQKDFISDFRTAFNLVFETNELTKTISIEPRDSYYNETSIDWTSKVDRTKGKIISHLAGNLGNEIEFSYSNDSNDKYVKGYEETYLDDSKLLSKTVSNTNKGAQDNTSRKQIKSFAPTILGLGIPTAPTVKVPLIWDIEINEIPETKTKSWKSRLLYYRGRTPLIGSEYIKYNGTNQSYYPEYTTNYIDALNKHTNSLDWNSQTLSLGLYDKHYKNTIKTLNESRKVEMYINLKSIDILNLNFKTPIYIEDDSDGNYYYLEKISDYAPELNKSTKVTLIKIVAQDSLAYIENGNEPIITPPYLEEDVIVDPVEPIEVAMVETLSVTINGDPTDMEFTMEINDTDANGNILPTYGKLITT